MENSNDTIGNRTRELPTCSAVPQPTAPPRAPTEKKYEEKIMTHMWFRGMREYRNRCGNVQTVGKFMATPATSRVFLKGFGSRSLFKVLKPTGYYTYHQV